MFFLCVCDFFISGKCAEGSPDRAEEEFGSPPGYRKCPSHKSQSSWYTPQEEIARYKALVNQLQREKEELLTLSTYPAAIRRPNSVWFSKYTRLQLVCRVNICFVQCYAGFYIVWSEFPSIWKLNWLCLNCPLPVGILAWSYDGCTLSNSNSKFVNIRVFYSIFFKEMVNENHATRSKILSQGICLRCNMNLGGSTLRKSSL